MFNQKPKSYKALNIFKQLPNNKLLKEIIHSSGLFLSNFWTSHAQKHDNRAAYWFIWFSALLQKQSERAWCTQCKADGLLAASRVSCSYILPVDHVPNGLQIIGPDIFILKVISMLPHVNPQQGDKTCWKETKATRFNLKYCVSSLQPSCAHSYPGPHPCPLSSFSYMIHTGNLHKNKYPERLLFGRRKCDK